MGTATTAADPPALTARQAEVFRLIVGFWAANLRPPSYRDLMGPTGITSMNGIVSVLRPLVRKGYLEPVDGTSRCLLPAGFRDAISPAARSLAERFLADRLKGATG